MIKQFGDWAIDWTQRTSDDEYQETMTYKADTVAMWMMPLVALTVGAIMAWALPDAYSLLSILPIFGVLIVQLASQAWMSNYAPRPKNTSPGKYILLAAIPGVALLAGIVFRAFTSAGDESLSLAGGMIVGAVIGAGLVALVAPRMFRSRHKADTDRLEAELED